MAESEAQAARAWLERFVETFAGMDAGPSDPVHGIREKAREMLEGEPNADDPFTIAKEMALALPADPRATGLGEQWRNELERIRREG